MLIVAAFSILRKVIPKSKTVETSSTPSLKRLLKESSSLYTKIVRSGGCSVWLASHMKISVICFEKNGIIRTRSNSSASIFAVAPRCRRFVTHAQYRGNAPSATVLDINRTSTHSREADGLAGTATDLTADRKVLMQRFNNWSFCKVDSKW